ncbi:hypothetical protein [Haloarcula pelagica]|uniref:hypothetical protein n=1 Tax=Haloarcula pelagica TaxID=3033389 RepID=UPI0024C30769|nr:hypothetical protein [Halomicroarcula sp. YJ-61-S]
MSSVSPHGSPADRAPDTSAIRSMTVRPVRFLAFWTGVLAPLAYPPLLLGQVDGHSVLLAGVVLANVVGLLLGRRYGDTA